MSGMKLKCDPKSAVLRSVGDEPNGVLGVSVDDDGAHWIIDPFFNADGQHTGDSGPKVNFVNEPKTEREVVTPEQVVEACDGVTELGVVWHMVEETTSTAVSLHTRRGWFDYIRAHVDQLEATCNAIAARLQDEGKTV